jgi:hypothetical protein
MSIIRNGQVTERAWYYAFSPMRLIELLMLFFQTLTSPESVTEIRARNLRGPSAPRPQVPKQAPAGNVRTLNLRDCGAGG